jgi:hypothetical protein
MRSELSEQLPSLSPDRSHNEVEYIVGSSRDYATGPLRASTLSNCDRSFVSQSEEVIHPERG